MDLRARLRTADTISMMAANINELVTAAVQFSANMCQTVAKPQTTSSAVVMRDQRRRIALRLRRVVLRSSMAVKLPPGKPLDNTQIDETKAENRGQTTSSEWVRATLNSAARVRQAVAAADATRG